MAPASTAPLEKRRGFFGVHQRLVRRLGELGALGRLDRVEGHEIGLILAGEAGQNGRTEQPRGEFPRVLAAGNRRAREGGFEFPSRRPAAQFAAHFGFQRLEERVGGLERVDADGGVADQPFLRAKPKAQRFGVGPVRRVQALEDAVGQFEQFASLL